MLLYNINSSTIICQSCLTKLQKYFPPLYDIIRIRRNGVVIRMSSRQSVDLGFIPLVESYQTTLKSDIHSPLFSARHLRDIAENNLAHSLIVSLSKALNGTPLPLCGRQVA